MSEMLLSRSLPSLSIILLNEKTIYSALPVENSSSGIDIDSGNGIGTLTTTKFINLNSNR